MEWRAEVLELVAGSYVEDCGSSRGLLHDALVQVQVIIVIAAASIPAGGRVLEAEVRIPRPLHDLTVIRVLLLFACIS